MHTSPLEQPGTGDAGGLNVYVDQTARRLGSSGVDVDVFTRSVADHQPRTVRLSDRVKVHHLAAASGQQLAKADLPGAVCAFTAEVLRAAESSAARFDLVHSHYWLSGQVGWLAADRWSVPLVHTMHTTALVKNRNLGVGETPEPRMRIVGEEQLVARADRLVVSTSDEGEAMVDLYGARPDRVDVVHPGVDLERYAPGDRSAARRTVDIPDADRVLLFVGRLDRHKGPDLLVRSAAAMVRDDPALRGTLRVVVCGGQSDGGGSRQRELQALADSLGVADLMDFRASMPPTRLAQLYRAADLVVVPSHSETFGLVALEAQACGTPVVAAAVGGLHTAVADGVGGILVPGHDPDLWGSTLATALRQPRLLQGWAAGAVQHAREFSWEATVADTLAVYRRARRSRVLHVKQFETPAAVGVGGLVAAN